MTITNGYTTLVKMKALMIPNGGVDTADDAVIEDMITQASRIIDNQTLRTFFARTETHYYDTPHGRYLLITDDDLLTITALTNGSGTAIAASAYKLYPLNSSPKWEIRLLGSAGAYWETTSAGDEEGAITVAGTWGYATAAPADIEGACQDIVVSAYHKRFGENVTGIATVTAAGVVLTPKDIPESAWKVIQTYKRLV